MTGETMFETPMISAPTADGYAQAMRALAERAQAFLDSEDEYPDSQPLFKHASQLSKEMREHNLQPRQKMTRTEVHHNDLRRFIDAIYEFVDLEDHDGELVRSWDVWDAFRRAVKSAARSAESHGPGDTTWAPEDDSNPFKTTPVPEPDPTAEPINGVRQGDWVSSSWDETPRRVLTGVTNHAAAGPSVRLSDSRDGTYFGGYFVQANMVGRDYVRCEPPAAFDDAGHPDAPALSKTGTDESVPDGAQSAAPLSTEQRTEEVT